MSDGIAGLRNNRRAQRSTRQAPPPRHPIPAAAMAELAESGDPQPGHDGAGDPAPANPPAPATAAATSDAAQRAEAPRLVVDVAAEEVAAAIPDLMIDWADPQMHVMKETRISVANSVATRFKGVADQPGAPPQTQLLMEAVNQQLERLPELVLARRPEHHQPESGFFLRRPAVQAREGWTSIYLRPNAGEVEALRRIVTWVSAVIMAQPGRKASSRSEVVTAALDATYPARRKA